jgi:hypothetical protein
MTPRKILLASAVLAVTSQASLAGGEPRYYQSPYPSEQPPVVVYTTPPNPIVGIVGGVVSLPFTVLGGIATAIAPPAVVSCVAPNGWLYPCAGPTPWPGYGGQGPLPPPPATTYLRTRRGLPTSRVGRRGIPAGTGATMARDALSATAIESALIDQELENEKTSEARPDRRVDRGMADGGNGGYHLPVP